MKRIRWIGVILVMVLLVLSTGSIFAQEARVKPAVEITLTEFLENKMECVVYGAPYDDDIGFRLFPIRYKHELCFVPKGVSLLRWFDGYFVEVIIEERISIVVPLLPLNKKVDLEGKDVVDASVDVYYRKWFKDIKKAKDYMENILAALENKEEISIEAYQISFRGIIGYRFFTDRKKYYFRKQGEDPVEFRYALEVVFSE